MNQWRRRKAWWWSACLLAVSGCAGWPGFADTPDLSAAGGSRLEMAAMSERLGRTDLAEKFYRDVLAQQPENQQAHHRLGALAAREGRWRAADDHFNAALRSGRPSADLLTDIAYAQYERRQVRAAERTLREALTLAPEHAKSRSLLALVLSEQGRFREGLAEFRQAVRGIEDHGGAGETYGRSIAAGATPAPPESTRRTEAQFAAAGMRTRTALDPSSRGAEGRADEETSLAADTPAYAPAISPAPANPLRAPSRSIEPDQAAPLVARAPTSTRPQPLPQFASAARLPLPPDLLAQPRGLRTASEQSVVVRIDAESEITAGLSPHMPVTAAVALTPGSVTSQSGANRRIRSVDPPPPSKVSIRSLKKDQDPATVDNHESADTSTADRSALRSSNYASSSPTSSSESASSSPYASERLANAPDELRTAVVPQERASPAEKPSVPGSAKGPALAPPAASKSENAEERSRAPEIVTAVSEMSVPATRAPLARQAAKKSASSNGPRQDQTANPPAANIGSATPLLARGATRNVQATPPVRAAGAPNDRGVLSRSARGASGSEPDRAATSPAAKAKPPAASASKDEPPSTADAGSDSQAKRVSFEETVAAAATERQAPAATDATPASGTSATSPAPTAPAMSLPVGLEFSLPAKAKIAPPSKR